MLHRPVMLEEIVTALCHRPTSVVNVPGRYLDCTFGNGGYSRVLLAQHKLNKIVAIDRDPSVFSAPILPEDLRNHPRLSLMSGSFSQMSRLLEQYKESTLFDGMVFDLGVSSMQLDTAERGFSYQRDGPLDMRMSSVGDDSGDCITAADVVNTFPPAELEAIFKNYGDEKRARRYAEAIVAQRQLSPILTTHQLVTTALGGLKNPAVPRIFQALRIFVNDEMGELEKGLKESLKLLKPGGALVAVSFHSLEDRIVKRFMLGNKIVLDVKFKSGVCPSLAEIASNNRARSATMRAAYKV